MSLKDKLQDDWKQALKAGDKFKAGTIALAKAAVLLIEKADGSKATDEQVIEVLAKEVKMRRESIVEFEKGNREDLVEKAKKEIEIFLSYLPTQLSEEEILQYIREAAVEVGANSIKDMGKLMTNLTSKTKGRADGKVVSNLVKQYLNK